MAERASQSSTAAFPANPTSAASARKFVHDTATHYDLPSQIVERAELVVSELVTNAILHTGTGPTVNVHFSHDVLRVEVEDSSPTAPMLRDYGREAITGRGLKVVSTSAINWGVDSTTFGKTVWAEFSTDHLDGTESTEITSHTNTEDDEVNPDATLVYFTDVPVDLYLQLEQHTEAVLREFELLLIKDNNSLASVVTKSTKHFRLPMRDLHNAAHEANEKNLRTATFTSLCDQQFAERAREFLGLMTEADRLSESGVLLTPPTPPELRALRYWFYEELEYQVINRRPPVPFQK